MKIVDCDEYTKRECRKKGVAVEPLPYPADSYTEKRAEFMKMETGADTSVPRNVAKSDMKKFMEASLGNTVNNAGLKKFMQYDRVVLRFTAAWDDRKSMFGDQNFFTVLYYVAEDQVEVLEQHQANNGKDPFPKLMKKQKLRKDFRVDDPNGRSDVVDDNEYYHWRDLNIGQEMNCYNRKFKLISADMKTREFYRREGCELAADIDSDYIREEPSRPVNEVPEHSGFGGMEDSLASCYSLVPKPPKTEFDKQGVDLPSTILRFQARMDPNAQSFTASDTNRNFVISYYLADGMIQVREPPQRNSGIVGGNYLSKRKMVNGGTDELRPFGACDFFAGAKVHMMTPDGKSCGKFIVNDVDEFTLKHMEAAGPAEFPLSDFSYCCAQLAAMRQSAGLNEEEFFEQLDINGDKKIGIGEFAPQLKKVYKNAGVDVGESFPDQIVITVFRKLDADKSGCVDIKEFCDALPN